MSGVYEECSEDDIVGEIWKSVAVPSIMCGMNVIVWNESETEKLETAE